MTFRRMPINAMDAADAEQEYRDAVQADRQRSHEAAQPEHEGTDGAEYCLGCGGNLDYEGRLPRSPRLRLMRCRRCRQLWLYSEGSFQRWLGTEEEPL